MPDNIPQFNQSQLNSILQAQQGVPLFGATPAQLGVKGPVGTSSAASESIGKPEDDGTVSEDLSHMSTEELERELSGAPKKATATTAAPQRGYLSDIAHQIKPGVIESFTQIAGLPGNIEAAGRWGAAKFGLKNEAGENFLPTSFDLEKRLETPEELAGAQTFPGKVARSAISFLPTALAAGFTGGGALAPKLASAALRSGAAATTGEGAGYLAEKLAAPELAPAAKMVGSMVGFGLPRGFVTDPARAPYARLLELNKDPVSVAEKSGSRLAATLEQKPPVRPGLNPTLRKAEERIPFPEPYPVGQGLSTIAGMVSALKGSDPGAVASFLGGPTVAGWMGSIPSAVMRSPPGQAWMRGWPTNPKAANLSLWAGPRSRYLGQFDRPDEEPSK